MNSPSTASEPSALSIENVGFTYPGGRGRPPHVALHDVSIEIPVGQSVALLGPNGSGKSTLMKVICGMLQPGKGRVRAFGFDAPGEIRKRLSVVFQSNGLDPHLTVFENLQCQARLYGLPRSEAARRIGEELERGHLADRRDTYVKALSGGLARRVDLVRALLHHPRLLLLDEPTTGLDPTARNMFLDSLEERRRETGLTLLMTTHTINEADRCERVVFVHQGNIAADDTPAGLRRTLGGAIVTTHEHEKTPPPVDGIQWERCAGGFTAHLGDDQEQSRAVAATLTEAGLSFTIAPPTLADAFTRFTGAHLDNDIASDDPEVGRNSNADKVGASR